MDKVTIVLTALLERLHDSTFRGPSLSEPIDDQCRMRFHATWEEVKAHMMQSVSNVEYAPGKKCSPSSVVQELCTGNWMMDRYARVLYLYFWPPGWVSDYAIKKAIEAVEGAGEKLIKDPCQYLFEEPPLYWELLRIARRILPDKVAEVLTSHGLS